MEEAGRPACWCPGDLSSPQHCRDVVQQTVDRFGRVDVLVSNAAYQMSHETLEEITDEEWDHTFATNVSRHVPPGQGGSAAHGSGLVDHRQLVDQLRRPRPNLVPYAATKGAIANFARAWRSCWESGASA